MSAPWAPLWRTTSRTMKLFTAFHLLINYGGEIHSTFGPSMLPTINTAGDWCIVDKWRYRLGRNLRVGDLVVASKPGGDDIFVLKRVIGMPGDIVLKDPSESKREFIKVPVGHMWIAGDNLSHSVDSRHYGPVPLALVRGRALGTI
ncbi:peptidase S24/S26A/S26B/S26C, partial [Protomyces lactucae-debilis]